MKSAAGKPWLHHTAPMEKRCESLCEPRGCGGWWSRTPLSSWYVIICPTELSSQKALSLSMVISKFSLTLYLKVADGQDSDGRGLCKDNRRG